MLVALADEPSVRALAAHLEVSPNTVKTQLRAIYRKFDVSTRADALASAAVRELLDGEPDRGRISSRRAPAPG